MELPKRKFKTSVQLQFASYFAVLTIVLLALLNTYPLRASRDVVFSEKENALMNRASVVSSSLSLLDQMTADNTRQVMGLLDVNDLNRILVTDETGAAIYDTVENGEIPEEITGALEGKAVFTSKFDMDAFASGAAVPVRSGGKTIGAVYISEYDAEQAALIVGIQHRLSTISISIAVVALVIIFFALRMMTRRITQLADGVRTVQSGDYSFRLELSGNDELTELGSELNHLTERLETTEAQRRRFVSDASHELKTPLASIRLLSDSIVQDTEMDSATMREFVTDIGTEAERLQRTTEKLLNLSRRDDGVQGDLQKVDLKAAVEGTHRLLAKDVKFKDLGLLVVDEEQRFGVTHKEAIKQMKRSVDVLTLTATPIPRTLHMSMVGIRDMSLLQSPPEERYPVQTYVVEYSDGLVRDAILRELSRGGQVYVLHNRVQTIEVMYARLKKLVPEARIAIGHGQMREHALEDVMLDFYAGKYDVQLTRR